MANQFIGGVYANFRARNEQFLNASKQNVEALKRQRRAASALRRSGRQLRRTFQQLTGSIGIFAGGAALGGVTASLNRFARESASIGASLRENSNRIGLTVEQIQTLGRVFEGGGASQEDFIKTFRRFNVALVEARNGLATYRRAFELAGIDVDEAAARGETAYETFLRLADSLSNISDEATRINIVNALGGRSAFALLNELQKGADSIREQQAEFAKLGVVTDQQATRLKALDQSYTNTTNVIKTAIAGIIADNAQLFHSLNQIANSAIPRAFERMVAALDLIRQNMEYVRAAASVLGAALLQRTGILTFIGALVRLPLATFAARGAIAALALGFGGLRKAIVRTGILAFSVVIGEAVYQFFRLRDALGGTGEVFTLLGRVIGEFWRRFRTELSANIANFLAFGRVIGRGIAQLLAGIDQVITSTINGIVGFNLGVARALSAFFGRVRRSIVLAFANIVNATIDGLENIYNGTQRQVLRAVATLVGAFRGAYRTVIAIFKNLPNALGNIFKESANRAINILQNAFGGDFAEGLKFQIPVSSEQAESQLQIFRDSLEEARNEASNIELPEVDYSRFRISTEGMVNEAQSASEEISAAFSEGFNIDVIDNSVPRYFDRMATRIQQSEIEYRRFADTLREGAGAATPALDELLGHIRSVGEQSTLSTEQTKGLAIETIAAIEAVGQQAQETLQETAKAAERTLTAGERITQQYMQNLDDAFNRGIDGVAQWASSAITGFESASEAAKSFARTLINDVLKALLRSGIQRLLLGFGFGIPGFASGGLGRRGLALVGERGPEIVDFESPGRVYTNEQLSGALSGGGGNVFNFSPVIQSSDSAAVQRALADAFPIFKREVLGTIQTDSTRNSSIRNAMRR